MPSNSGRFWLRRLTTEAGLPAALAIVLWPLSYLVALHVSPRGPAGFFLDVWLGLLALLGMLASIVCTIDCILALRSILNSWNRY